MAEERAYAGAVKNVRTVEVLEEGTVYSRVWQPYVERWDDDHLVVAWGHALNGKTDMGDLVCAVTRDGVVANLAQPLALMSPQVC